MITLYLVRHGQCEHLAEDYIQGQMDSPLTKLGARQAQAAAARLADQHFDAIYSSDLSRTRATAEAIAAPHSLPVQVTPLIRECHLGEAQGITVGEFARRCPEEYRLWQEDPIANRPPGAERFEDVIARCGRFLEQLRDSHADGETVCAAVHIGSTCGLLCAALSLPVPAYFAFHVANCSVSILELGPTSMLRVLNDTCHLRGAV